MKNEIRMNRVDISILFLLQQGLRASGLLVAKKKPLTSLFFLLFLGGMLGSEKVMAATKTWVGPAAGGSWATAANWSPATAPSPTDDIVFNTAGTLAITAVPTVSIASLTISQGSVTLTGATATNVLTIGSLAAATDLSIAVGASLTTSNVKLLFTATNFTANNAGTLTVNTGGSIDLNGNNLSLGTLTISGNGNAAGQGAIMNSSTTAATLTSAITLSTNATTAATGTGGLTLSGDIANGGFTLTTDGANATNISGIISGTGGLTKTGAGTLTLSAANTYSGATAVNTGTLKVGNAAALGDASAATTVASGAVLDLNGFTIGENVSIAGTGIASGGALINSSATPATLSGTLTLTAAASIGGTGNITLDGAISGNFALTKVGTNTLTISASNSSTALITVSAGTLKLDDPNALGTTAANTVVASGAVLDLNGTSITEPISIAGTGIASSGALINSGATATASGNITMTAASSIGGTGNITVSSTISGAFALTKVGTNTLTLSGNNSYTGATTISSGILQLGAAGTATNTPLGTSAGGVTVQSGATLDLNGFSLATTEALTLNGTGVAGAGALINSGGVGGTTTATWAGTVAQASASTIGGTANITLSQNITGAFALTKEGENTLLLNSSTTTSAFTTLNINNGTVQLGTTGAANGQIVNTCAVVINGDGSLNLGSQSEQIGSLASTSATATVTALSGTPVLTVGDATNTTFAGVIQNGGGTVSLVKVGTGTLTLSGTNTYTGTTTINAGILALGASNVIADTSNVLLGGGTLSSGGFSDTMGTLSTTTATSSTIALSGTSTLNFAAGGTILGNLAITGYGTSAGHIFIGNSQTLSVTELSKITVNGSPACQATTGEIIPKGTVSTTSGVIFTTTTTTVTFQQTGGTVGGTWSISPTTMGTINASTGVFTAGTTTGLVVATYTSPEGCESTMDFYVSATGNLWVNPSTGNDVNIGTPASPLQSIRQALRNLTATNSIIHIMPGNYPYSTMTSNANRDLGFGPGTSVTSGINNAFLPGTIIQGEGCVYWNNNPPDGNGPQNSIMTVEAVDSFVVRNIRFNGWQGTLASMHFINCTHVWIEDCVFHQDALPLSGHALRFEGDAVETAISGTPSLYYNIKNCVFQNNGNPSGQSTGEALYIRNNGTSHLPPATREFKVNIYNSSFVCNFASTGGALYSEAINSADEHPNILISGCNFSGNKTSSQGGAIFHKYTDLTVQNTTFCNNDAGSALSDRDGGAIHCDQGSTLNVTGSTFQDNVAGRYGSAISIASNATSSSVSNCVFYSNNSGNSTSNVYRSAIANATLTNCLFKDNALTAGFAGGPVATGGTITNSTFSGNAGTAVSGIGVIDDHALGANWVDATGHAFQANGTQVGYTGSFYSLPDCTSCPSTPGTGCDASAGAGLMTNSTCFYICSDTTATTDISKGGTITVTTVSGWAKPCDITSLEYHYYFLVVNSAGTVVKVVDGDADSDGIPNFAESPAVNTDINVGGITPPGVYTIRGYYTDRGAPTIGTAIASLEALTCGSVTSGAIAFTILDAVRIDMTRSCTTTPGNVQAPSGQFYINITNVTGGFANLNPAFFTPKSYTITTSFGAGSYNYTGTAINNIAVTYAAGTDETAQVSAYSPQPNLCSNCQSQVFRELDLNCAVVTLNISGNVYNDANGLTDNTVNGTAIDGTSLVTYANLVSGGNVEQSVQISATGTYTFPNVTANTTYTVILTTTAQTIGNPLSTATVPNGYTSTGENIGTIAGDDGLANSIISVSVVTSDVINVNFGIEQRPTATSINATPQVNPGNTTQVIVPTLTGNDAEDGQYNGTSGTNDIVIQTLPNALTQGLLYYNGVLVTAGQTIIDYNPSLLTVDPINGAVTVSFTYSEKDAAGLVSLPATVNMPFTTLNISGNVYNDANGLMDNTVNGTAIDGTTLVTYANLVSGGNVEQSVQISATGTYTFPNVTANTTYTVILTTTAQTIGNPLSTATVPNGYTSTGENIGTIAGDDGLANSIISVSVVTSDVINVNFGIEQRPTANSINANPQVNPGSTTQVIVPTLTGNDAEDGPYNGTSGTNDIVIQTLPNALTQGLLYYNGVLVTAGQTIIDYNPSLLTVDPINGAVTVSFTYSEKDAAGLVSLPATVNMPFTTLNISGTLFSDNDALTDNAVDGTPIGSAGVTQLYANLVQGGAVVQSVTLPTNGVYTFTNLDAGSYTVVIASAATATTPLIPAPFANVGETFGTNNGAGTGNEGGTPNGSITTTLITNNITGVDFGIYAPIIDLSVVKTVSNATPTIGTTVTFTITVANAAGFDNATGVSVSDVVPSGYGSISGISNGGTLSGSTITWSGLSINSGSSVALTFSATVLATGVYLNMAQVSAADQTDTDSTPNNSLPVEDDQDDVTVSPASACNPNSGTWVE